MKRRGGLGVKRARRLGGNLSVMIRQTHKKRGESISDPDLMVRI
jgi:hypothetical protein